MKGVINCRFCITGCQFLDVISCLISDMGCVSPLLELSMQVTFSLLPHLPGSYSGGLVLHTSLCYNGKHEYCQEIKVVAIIINNALREQQFMIVT